MKFESQQKRKLIVSIFIGFIPDIMVAWIITYFAEGGIIGFFWALIAIYGLALLFWAKNSIWNWVYFYWSGRKEIADNIFIYLKENGLPKPEELENSAQDYFDRIVNNENYSVNIRIRAAVLSTEMTTLSLRGPQMALRLVLAYEDALKRYAESLPQKKRK